MTKRYVKWAEGIAVSEEDAAALETDRRLFGTAYVETIGHGYGRRIAPGDIRIRAADSQQEGDRK